MLNAFDCGKRIAKRRHELNMTQEQLVERVGEENISLSTLKRIESGNGNIDVERLSQICEALDCRLQDVLSENILEQAITIAYDSEKAEIQDCLYRQRLFYPELSKSLLYDDFPIKSLLQFIIYLPLMDEDAVLDVLQRIGGDAFDNEYYVLEKLQFLYKTIPDNKAKQFADYEAAKCTYQYFEEFYTVNIGDDLTEADKIWSVPERRKEMYACYDEYMATIEKKKKARSNTFSA